MAQQFLMPPGRIIWGNPLQSRFKMNTNVNPPVPVLDAEGKKIEQWAFGYAIDKPTFNQYCWMYFQAEASSIFPQGFPPDFAWKFKDGDTALDGNGKPLRDKEGYAGNIVVTISTEAFAPKIVQLMQGAYHAVTAGLKTGDYVRVAVQLVAHAKKPGGGQSKPGMYVNPQLIEWIGVGKEIYNGPDAMAVFGGAAAQLPAGAMPIGSMPIGGGGMPGQMPGQQQPMQPMQQMPGQQPMQPMQQMPGQQPMQQMPGQQPGNAYGAPGAVPPGMNPAGFPQQQQPAQSPTAFQSNGGAPMPDYRFVGGAPMPDYRFVGGAPAQPQQMPGQMPQQMPGQMPQQMPGQMPNGMPGQNFPR